MKRSSTTGRQILLLCALIISVLSFSCKGPQSAGHSDPVAAPSPPSPAKGGNWVLLGERLVNHSADHDEILVTGQKGAFTALQFKVKRAGMMIRNIRIVYGNGESQNFVLNKKFPAGSESRILNLPGNKRIIKKIVFNYKTAPNRDVRAMLQAWGRR